MTAMTMPEQATVAAEIRLFFGPEIEDDTIESTLREALADLREFVAPDQLLESTRRLTLVRLDELARSTDRTIARPGYLGSGRMP